MSDAFVLFGTEVRRCLARRLVWVLVTLALLAIALVSVLAFVNTSKTSTPRRPVEANCIEKPTEGGGTMLLCPQAVPVLVADNRLHLTDLWPEDDRNGDRFLAPTVVFLAIGALLGGASMVGAEWRAGSIATLLTWEPRRVRLAIAKLVAAACVAAVIAFLLQVVFVAGLLPAVFAHGTTEGADGGWFLGLLGAMARSEALVAMAAVLGGAVAMIGRNTAAALGASFAYMMIGENLVRAWKPWLRPWLVAENAFIFLAGFAPDELTLGRSFGAAGATLLLYTLGLAAVAVATFRVRDIAST
jgi:ABC-2 family transporter